MVLHMPDDDDGDDDEGDGDEDLVAKRADLLDKARAQFGTVLRSKGFMWVAHDSSISLTWSHAGVMLNVDGGHKWFAEQDASSWPPETRKAIEMDFEGEFGDRRQELVFIGSEMNQGALTASLNSCLLTNDEMVLGSDKWPTAFAHDWPRWHADGNDFDEEDKHRHEHHEHEH